MKSDLTITERLIALLGYVIVLTVASGLITGTWIPTGGLESVWYFAAIALVFFTELSAPFFVPPRDSLVNSVTSALLLATLDLQAAEILRSQLNTFRWIAFGLAVFTAIASITAIALYRSGKVDNSLRSALSRIAYWTSTRLGRGQIVFTPVVLISIAGGYQGEPIQQILLLLVWSVVVFMEPVDLIIAGIKEIRQLRSHSARPSGVGEIQRVDDPGILRVRLENPNSWTRDTIHIACLSDSRQLEVVPLFTQLHEDEIIGTGICHRQPPTSVGSARPGIVYRVDDARDANDVLLEMCGAETQAELIGFVVENSEISIIRFEVSSEVDIEEGSLVFVNQADNLVHFQIVGAKTDEEVFSTNPRGNHIAQASQLGVLSADGGFESYPWLPSMNAPVFLIRGQDLAVADEEADKDQFRLGTVPNSNMPVFANLADMIEYHTAILGITGMGKTELAFDIIRQAHNNGVKIFCVDFTGEYEPRLADLQPQVLGLESARAAELQDRLFDVEEGEYAAGNEKQALREFIGEIAPDVRDQITTFLEPEGAALGIFDLEEIANTKATLRATELYLSSIFEWARKNKRKRQILLVLEEAHTVIPEFNLYARDRVETGAVVGRMGQIALQGRKYGVGILLISQRTALVSKTLLSQCNTVITFALHDQTGLNYLSTVFSSDYVSTIPNLAFLQAVGFGKAIRSTRPIIFQIPESEEKRRASEVLYDR